MVSLREGAISSSYLRTFVWMQILLISIFQLDFLHCTNSKDGHGSVARSVLSIFLMNKLKRDILCSFTVCQFVKNLTLDNICEFIDFRCVIRHAGKFKKIKNY